MHRTPLDQTLDWLQLARCEGVGPVTFTALLERHRTVATALRAARQQPGPGGAARRLPNRTDLAAEIDALAALGGRMLIKAGAGYPPLLQPLPDAPPVLSVLGDAALLDRPAVAVVGARNASANGCAFARALGRELARAGLVVVSGLARGIDTAAHEGALAGDGATVAVIAAGVDVAYPPENAALMARIAAEGAVVSERPLGATARAKDFPRRNRVIAGLALGVVVVEAAPASGSLITATARGRIWPRGDGGAGQPAGPAPSRHQPAAARRGASGRECRRRAGGPGAAAAPCGRAGAALACGCAEDRRLSTQPLAGRRGRPPAVPRRSPSGWRRRSGRPRWRLTN